MQGRLSIGLATAVASIALTASAQAATTITVCATGCDQTTIGAAIAAASDGDTISVGAGTYREQLDVDKSVTIAGAARDQTTIESPDAASVATSFTTVGGTADQAIVFADAPNVTIEDLTVDGRGQGNGNAHFDGIAAYNQSLTVEDVHVTGVRDTPLGAGDSGVGIYVRNETGAHRADVDDSKVDDYQQAGIRLVGTDLTVSVIGSDVTGAGPTSVIAQEGIEVTALGDGSPGPTGEIGRVLTTSFANECDAPLCGPDLEHDTHATGVRLVGVGDFDLAFVVLTTDDVGVDATAGPGATLQIGNDDYLQNPTSSFDNRVANFLLGEGDTTIGRAFGIGGAPYGVAVVSSPGDTHDASVAILNSAFEDGGVGLFVEDTDSADAVSASASVHQSWFEGNTLGIENDAPADLDAADNIWAGCNGGPNSAGCDPTQTTGGAVLTDPVARLEVTAGPPTLVNGDYTSVVSINDPFGVCPSPHPDGPYIALDSLTTDLGSIDKPSFPGCATTLHAHGHSGVAHIAVSGAGQSATATVTFPAPPAPPPSTDTTTTTTPDTPPPPPPSSTEITPPPPPPDPQTLADAAARALLRWDAPVIATLPGLHVLGKLRPVSHGTTAVPRNVAVACSRATCVVTVGGWLRVYDTRNHLTRSTLGATHLTLHSGGARVVAIRLDAAQRALVRASHRAYLWVTINLTSTTARTVRLTV